MWLLLFSNVFPFKEKMYSEDSMQGHTHTAGKLASSHDSAPNWLYAVDELPPFSGSQFSEQAAKDLS